MTYTPAPQDARLRCEFYDREITEGRNPRSEEWVRIFNPDDNRNEFHAPAHSVWAPVDGEDVTYAMRFAPVYKAFKDGDATRKADRLVELRKQLALAEAEAGVAKPLEGEALRKAVDDAAALRTSAVVTEPAADVQKVQIVNPTDGMSDDDLRAAVEARTGQKVPGTITKRETLERLYRDA